jgi:3-dehydroquinate dehydratase / shikimate dehydrogenase
MLIVASICQFDPANIQHYLQEAIANADVIELRLDYWQPFDFVALKRLRQLIIKPVIFTLRAKSHGGYFQQSERLRLQCLATLCELSPDYIDLEYNIDPLWIAQLHAKYPAIKLIASYHNFDHTPDDLDSIFANMQSPLFDCYKLATLAHSSIDCLRLLNFVRTRSIQYHLTGIAMGEYGTVSRILSPVVGNTMLYANTDQQNRTAPGQLTIDELNHIYRVPQLNKATKIYALIGDPICYSQGHIIHNYIYQILMTNAVYVKLAITPAQLPEAMLQLKQLKIAGVSITMPLKESILPYLDDIDPLAQAILAVNTIVTNQNHWLGQNTDGQGAITALLKRGDIQQKTIIIIGAGGACRAIAYYAKLYEARVIICHHNRQKAQRLADEFALDCISLESLYDKGHVSYDNGYCLSTY